MSFVEFRDTQTSLANTLSDVVNTLPQGSISLRELLALIGEQGMLFFCIIMTIPFLTPLPLPGISTVFGILIMLISVGVILNRVPWLPRQLMNRRIGCAQLAPVLRRGAQLFSRVERFIRPRFPALTHESTINRLNGLLLLLAGFLLILPLPVIPFSNMLPGWAVLLLAAGMLQRDGIFVLIGYGLTLFTAFYLGGCLIAAVIAGQGLGTIFSGVMLPVW